MSKQHQPVLLVEVLHALDPSRGGVFIDATFGRGGHTQALLEQLTPGGQCIAIDQDSDAIRYGQASCQDARLTLIHDSFRHLKIICEMRECVGKVQGILMDLGVSSPQLDEAHRGFSFMREGPLDMRMDISRGMTAAALLESWSEQELTDCLFRYGEEKHARRIAHHIKKALMAGPIRSTSHLADIIAVCYPKGYHRIHPATRSFQALRIAVNDELSTLETALSQAFSVLAVGGRLAVISFHSLEDRVVKHFMQSLMQDPFPKHLPIKACDIEQKCFWIAKMVRASSAEIEKNVRARSAVLRVIEKSKAP